MEEHKQHGSWVTSRLLAVCCLCNRRLRDCSPSLPSAPKHFFSDAAPPTAATIRLPISCWDVALTRDGLQLLLPARKHGLIELCSSSGRERSRWLPPPSHSGAVEMDDEVNAVATLSDGRAAVGLYLAQVIVLLRRRNESNGNEATDVASNDAWTEDRRLDQLQWVPGRLAIHGDVIAVSERLGIRRLRLMSLSSGRLLCAEQQREYDIGSLAVAARVVVTASPRKVKLSDRRRAHVLDAHSVAKNKRLWRHDLSSGDNDKCLTGVCIDSTDGLVYAAEWRSSLNSSGVSAISMADGSSLQFIVLNFSDQLLMPVRLSFIDWGATEWQQQQQREQEQQLHSNTQSGSSRSSCRALAVLWVGENAGDMRTVTVYHSLNE